MWPVTLFILVCCLQAFSGILALTAVELVEDKATCGAHQINHIRCTLQQSADEQELPYISALALRWDDGKQQTLCSKSRKARRVQRGRSRSSAVEQNSNSTGTINRHFMLARGDAFYGVRVCYDSSQKRLVGLMLTAASGQFVCGNIWRYPQWCVSSRTLTAAPLSHIGATCAAEGLSSINQVCWNKYYIPQQPRRVCPAGQGMSASNAVTYCQACLTNTFNPGGLHACARCPADQTTSKNGSSSCGCPAGYGYHAINHQCQKCPQGTYSPGGAINPCIRCPYPFMMSPRGSALIEACVCQPGYGYSSSTGGCVPCGLNKYSDGTHDAPYESPGVPTLQPCRSCPAGTRTLRPQAIRADRCRATS